MDNPYQQDKQEKMLYFGVVEPNNKIRFYVHNEENKETTVQLEFKGNIKHTYYIENFNF